MTNRYEPTNYGGVNKSYTPTGGSNSAKSSTTTNLPFIPTDYSGYYDLPYLKNLLDENIKKCTNFMSICTNKLFRMSFIIDSTDKDLISAHKVVYPLTPIPEFISFKEYLFHFNHKSSHAEFFVIRAFENAIRGPSGSNALDIYHILRLIIDEANRIKEFIENESFEILNDSSQHRTIEIFQDWGEAAQRFIAKAGKTLQGEVSSSINSTELDRLTKKQASELQGFFQVKLNVLNSNIEALFNQIHRDWESSSDFFYTKVLGAALHFQLKIAKNLRDKFNPETFPTIGLEVNSTMVGFDTNYSVALADQIKRNSAFWDLIPQIFANIEQRDVYCNYIMQLSSKGTSIKSIFSSESSVENQNFVYIENKDKFKSSHSTLADIELDDAHPQYLLRSGGVDSKVTGDIYFANGVKIDGIDPSAHIHNGTDGSSLLTDDSFATNSLSERVINNSSATTQTPTNISLISQTSSLKQSGEGKVKAVVSFKIEELAAGGYEFEIVKV